MATPERSFAFIRDKLPTITINSVLRKHHTLGTILADFHEEQKQSQDLNTLAGADRGYVVKKKQAIPKREG
jgi:hypothetical protein